MCTYGKPSVQSYSFRDEVVFILASSYDEAVHLAVEHKMDFESKNSVLSSDGSLMLNDSNTIQIADIKMLTDNVVGLI